MIVYILKNHVRIKSQPFLTHYFLIPHSPTILPALHNLLFLKLEFFYAIIYFWVINAGLLFDFLGRLMTFFKTKDIFNVVETGA